MKKITIGILTFLICLIASLSLEAAPTVSSKKEVTIPHYNSDFNFGLACHSLKSAIPVSTDLKIA